MRSFIKLPAHRHGEHLLSERRDEAADQIKQEIPIPQNGIGIMPGLQIRQFACLTKRLGIIHWLTDCSASKANPQQNSFECPI